MTKYWIKLYHEVLHDPKMGKMGDYLWRKTIELFLLAGENDQAGALPPLPEMAWSLRVSEEQLETDLVELQRVGITSCVDGVWIITKFVERQDPMDKAEYMRRKREETRRDKYYQPDTNSRDERYQSVTNGNTDTDTDTDKDKEADKEADSCAAAPRVVDKPPLSEGQRYFLSSLGAQRFKTTAQREAVKQLEQSHGTAKLWEGIEWAAKRGMNLGAAVLALEKALPKWGEPKPNNGARGSPGQPDVWQILEAKKKELEDERRRKRELENKQQR